MKKYITVHFMVERAAAEIIKTALELAVPMLLAKAGDIVIEAQKQGKTSIAGSDFDTLADLGAQLDHIKGVIEQIKEELESDG